MARMNAEKGTRYRLEGLLLRSKRGLLLQIDEGGVWALDADDVRPLYGRRVQLEGIRSGFDRIDVEWVDPRPRRPADEAHRGESTYDARLAGGQD